MNKGIRLTLVAAATALAGQAMAFEFNGYLRAGPVLSGAEPSGTTQTYGKYSLGGAGQTGQPPAWRHPGDTARPGKHAPQEGRRPLTMRGLCPFPCSACPPPARRAFRAGLPRRPTPPTTTTCARPTPGC